MVPGPSLPASSAKLAISSANVTARPGGVKFALSSMSLGSHAVMQAGCAAVGAGVTDTCGFRLDGKCATVSEGPSRNVWVTDCPAAPSSLSKGQPLRVSSDDFAMNLNIPGCNHGVLSSSIPSL